MTGSADPGASVASAHGAKTTPVVVALGPGRCGTSLLMRLLRECGLRLSTDLVPESAANPDGHLEDLHITEAQQRFLAAATLRPHAPRPADVLATPDAEALTTSLAEIVRGEVAGDSLWGFKDPRTCLTWPLWSDVFARTETVPIPLYCVRDSRAVVQSIMHAYGMAQDVAEALCLFRSVQVLQDVREPWCFVQFERWSTEPHAQLAAVVEHCGLPTDPATLRTVVAANFRPELDRQSSSRSIDVSPVLCELDELLSSCVDTSYDAGEIDRWCRSVIQRVDDFAFLQDALHRSTGRSSRELVQAGVRSTLGTAIGRVRRAITVGGRGSTGGSGRDSSPVSGL